MKQLSWTVLLTLLIQQLFCTAIWAQEGIVEEILVTGSHIRRKSQLDSMSPIFTIAREEIDSTGILTSQELFRWFPANSGSENQIDILTASASAGTANVNLRCRRMSICVALGWARL